MRTFITWLKRIVLAAVVLAIVAALVWSMIPRPVPVEAAAVTRGPMRVTIDEDGRARVQHRHVVAAPLAGSLARIELRPGDPVEAGAVVARIAPLPSPLLDPRSRAEVEGRVAVARAARRQAEAGVERARTAAEFAARELARVRRLAEQGAAPRVELERRQLEADVASRDLASARFAAAVAASEVTTAEALVARLGKGGRRDEEVVVQAPVAGRVLRVIAESEGVVAPGTPLVEVGDPARLEIVVDVLTADAVSIRPGAPVSVEAWGGPPLAGVVRLVEPSAVTRISALGVEEQRVNAVVDLAGSEEARAGLGDGWRVEARILTWQGEDVLQVPLGALFRAGDSWAVYVVDAGRARQRLVEIGRRSGTTAQVLEGLREGEPVILHPGERLRDGVRIAAR
jgi:HlyD family secretion protein